MKQLTLLVNYCWHRNVSQAIQTKSYSISCSSTHELFVVGAAVNVLQLSEHFCPYPNKVLAHVRKSKEG